MFIPPTADNREKFMYKKSAVCLLASLLPTLCLGQENFESPGLNSIESGVGIIRGWSCKAGAIKVVIDGTSEIDLPHGGSRLDTSSVCKNGGNNGFGAVVFWPSYGLGEHEAKLYIDGVLIKTQKFTITGASEQFIKDKSHEFSIINFPAVGTDKTLVWSQAHQNFVFKPK